MGIWVCTEGHMSGPFSPVCPICGAPGTHTAPPSVEQEAREWLDHAERLQPPLEVE